MNFIIKDKDYDNLLLTARIINLTNISMNRMNKVCPVKYKHSLRELQESCIFLQINNKIHNYFAYVCQSLTKVENSRSFVARYAGDISKFSDEQLMMIVAHETAHLLDFIVRGDSFHDKEWKLLAIYFGAQPDKSVDLTSKCINKTNEFNEMINSSRPHKREKLINEVLNMDY